MGKGRLCVFPGQITIEEWLSRIEAEKPEETKENYLSKGERLTTLARKKFERMMDRLSFTELEKKIYSTKLPEHAYPDEIVDILSKGVVRPLLKACSTFDESDGAYMSLKGVIDFDFTVEPADEGRYGYNPARRYLRYRQKKTGDILVLTVKEEGWPDMRIFGYRAFAMSKKRNDLLYKDGSVASDVAVVLSWLILFTLYNRAMSDSEMEDAITGAFSDDRVNVDAFLRRYVLNSSGIELKHGFSPLIPAYMAPESYKALSDPVKGLFYSATGCRIIGASDYPVDILKNRNREGLASSSDPKPFGYLVEPGVEWILLRQDPVKAFKAGIGRAGYNQFLVRGKKDNDGSVPSAWAMPHLYRATGNDDFTIVLTRVMAALWEKKGVIAKVCQYYKDLQKEGKRTKVYQTKKGIPQKVIKKMEESSLNSHFGYVEFDESCDLDAMEVISSEFENYKEKYLPFLNVKEVSVRFRLLGNYRAAGLFFPSINCLCVDVRHPASFIHELGHCIDYLKGRLSERQGFSECYSAYRKAFLEGLPEKKRAALATTKSKYNLDYYLLPTEAFARCMEMYVSRGLKKDLSICKIEEEMDWAYPVDSTLMEAINDYFGALFELFSTAERKAA